MIGRVTHYDAVRGVAVVRLEDDETAEMSAVAFLSGRPARLPQEGDVITAQLQTIEGRLMVTVGQLVPDHKFDDLVRKMSPESQERIAVETQRIVNQQESMHSTLISELPPLSDPTQEALTLLLEQKLASGDPVILNTLMRTGLLYIKDRLTEQKKRKTYEGAHLPDRCTMQPDILHHLLRIFEEAQARLNRASNNAKMLESLPDRFSLSAFHNAGLSLEASSTALYVARRILEETENEPPAV